MPMLAGLFDSKVSDKTFGNKIAFTCKVHYPLYLTDPLILTGNKLPNTAAYQSDESDTKKEEDVERFPSHFTLQETYRLMKRSCEA